MSLVTSINNWCSLPRQFPQPYCKIMSAMVRVTSKNQNSNLKTTHPISDMIL